MPFGRTRNSLVACTLGIILACFPCQSKGFYFIGGWFSFQVNAQTHVVVGDAKERICEVVEKLHADTLVMGSRAFGPIKR